MTGALQPGWKSWLKCVALANLCFVRIWLDLLAHFPWPANRDYDPPGAWHYGAAMILVILLGSASWGLAKGLPQRPFRFGLACCGTALLLKELFLGLSGLGWFVRVDALRAGLWQVLLLCAAILLSGWIVYRHWGSAQRIILAAGSAAVPLLALAFGQAVWLGMKPRVPAVRTIERATPGQRPAPRRVVWIVLDEIDERVAFSDRRAEEPALPALDRFRREAAWVALQAKSPANATAESIPLLVGEPASEWNVFRRAKELGLRAGALGWAVPYCPRYGSALEACAWWPMPQQANSYGDDLGSSLGAMLVSMVESNQISPLGQTLAVKHFVRTVQAMRGAAAAMAARRDLDFVYLHLPPPHNPYVYDPETGQLDRTPRLMSFAGYQRNLQLADLIFGEIRAAMEHSGVWERSIVLVTGDHGLRSRRPERYGKSDLHVPFVLKADRAPRLDPGQPFETRRTADILLDLVRPEGEPAAVSAIQTRALAGSGATLPNSSGHTDH